MMGKGVFTYCKLDDEDKCPAWSIRANKIEHIKSKKTIYYENAVLKDFLIFLFFISLNFSSRSNGKTSGVDF